MMPMRTIGYLLGIPEEQQMSIRDRNAAFIDVAKGRQPGEVSQKIFEGTIVMFAEFIDWRAEHPSDDLMTELLAAEIEEPDGTRRPLSRTEAPSYTVMIAGAGNETTARLIGFMGQLLSDHPDQRRELAADPSLIPDAVEESLRYEPPSPVQARYVAQDAEHYGRVVPEGSFMLLLNASANRDEHHFPDPDRFDIHRRGSHLSFGQGLHFCLGSALARLELGWPSKRSSNAGRTGKSTTPTPNERTPQACAGGHAYRSAPAKESSVLRKQCRSKQHWLPDGLLVARAFPEDLTQPFDLVFQKAAEQGLIDRPIENRPACAYKLFSIGKGPATWRPLGLSVAERRIPRSQTPGFTEVPRTRHRLGRGVQ